MDATSFIRLMLLGAIWGSSFLFMRISVPVLGAPLVTELRLAIAALFLLLVGMVLKKQLNAREHWRHYLLLGLINTALPFLLFAMAAQTLTASLLSVLNATAPIWGAVIAAVWTRTPLTRKTQLGLALGVTGVSLLVGFDSVAMRPGAGLAVIEGLAAAFLYGVASVYAKSAKKVDAFSNAHGSLWAAALFIIPVLPFAPIISSPGTGVIFAALALGVLCSGVAYLLYFRLIDDVGPASALTVTFLIPVFGVLWGCLFLDEHIGVHTIFGSGIVIVGTALVTGFSPASLFKRKPV